MNFCSFYNFSLYTIYLYIKLYVTGFMKKEIDPWSSDLLKNYQHLIKEFGLFEFDFKDKELDSYFVRRNIIIAHRNFEKVVARIKANKPFINMTGIASSGRVHLGHKVDIDVSLFLQRLGAINYFCVADLDAYLSRPDEKIRSLENAKKNAVENLAHAFALGIDPKKSYAQSNKPKRYYEFSFEISKKITQNTYKAIYGHTDLGKISSVLLQIADILHPQLKEFEGKMPSVTGIGLDQDPHARLTRDVMQRLSYPLEVPSFLYFSHQAGLNGNLKMSSSEPDNTIFLDDNESDVKKKISRALTGGRNTSEEQKRLGGEPDKCMVYELYKYHFTDESRFNEIRKTCISGERTCGECKKECIVFFQKMLKEHQEKYEGMLSVAKEVVFGKMK